MARKNGRGAVKLFGNENAGDLVRPGELAQRQNEIGA
jgi:hypothetical protein